jgi:hypothetical protein
VAEQGTFNPRVLGSNPSGLTTTYPQHVATFDDVRRVALGLPEVTMNDAGTEFRVDGKLFAHPWLERVDPKRARVPNLDVAVVRIASESDKEVLIQMDPAVFFTEPHFDGYASIHVRLAAVSEPLLEQLIADAWRVRAPKRLVARA